MADGWVAFQHNGKRVGFVRGSVFHTSRLKGKHFSYVMDGYGIQRRLLRDLIAQGVATIRLDLLGLNVVEVFNVDAAWWLQCGTVAALTHQDGSQVFLSVRQLTRWRQ